MSSFLLRPTNSVHLETIKPVAFILFVPSFTHSFNRHVMNFQGAKNQTITPLLLVWGVQQKFWLHLASDIGFKNLKVSDTYPFLPCLSSCFPHTYWCLGAYLSLQVLSCIPSLYYPENPPSCASTSFTNCLEHVQPSLTRLPRKGSTVSHLDYVKNLLPPLVSTQTVPKCLLQAAVGSLNYRQSLLQETHELGVMACTYNLNTQEAEAGGS